MQAVLAHCIIWLMVSVTTTQWQMLRFYIQKWSYKQEGNWQKVHPDLSPKPNSSFCLIMPHVCSTAMFDINLTQQNAPEKNSLIARSLIEPRPERSARMRQVKRCHKFTIVLYLHFELINVHFVSKIWGGRILEDAT